jgi:Fe-S-cluster-containing dehydrogenase component
MVFDTQRCLGEECLRCKKACSADAIRIYPDVSATPFLCDLCDVKNQGVRAPQCVNVCPYGALYFKTTTGRFGYSIRDVLRIHPDRKAELMSKRLYPLPKNSMGYPGWR